MSWPVRDCLIDPSEMNQVNSILQSIMNSKSLCLKIQIPILFIVIGIKFVSYGHL